MATQRLCGPRSPQKIDRRWSRKHAHTQRRLCERFAAPVVGDVLCQDIMTWHMQQVVNAAPTAKEGARVHGMISALIGAGPHARPWVCRTPRSG